LSRGAIHKILTNPIYIGKIRHKDKTYQGQHDAIVRPDIWDQVQATLQSSSQKRRGHQLPTSSVAWLKGKLFDPTGDHLTPSHTRKNGRAIRYYISNRLLSERDPTGYRLSAEVLEQRICVLIAEHLAAITNTGRLIVDSSIDQLDAMRTTVANAFDLLGLNTPQTLENFADVLKRGDIQGDGITLHLDRTALGTALGIQPTQISESVTTIIAQFELRKRGVEQKIILGDMVPEPDRILRNALAAAHLWLEQVKSGMPLAQITANTNAAESQVRQRIRLVFLSPKLQAAIMAGTQPADLSLAKLLRVKIDPSWQQQEQHFLR